MTNLIIIKKAEKVDKKYLKYSVDEKELQGLAHEEYLKILDMKKTGK